MCLMFLPMIWNRGLTWLNTAASPARPQNKPDTRRGRNGSSLCPSYHTYALYFNKGIPQFFVFTSHHNAQRCVACANVAATDGGVNRHRPLGGRGAAVKISASNATVYDALQLSDAYLRRSKHVETKTAPAGRWHFNNSDSEHSSSYISAHSRRDLNRQ